MSFLRFSLDNSPLDDEGFGLDGEGFAFTSNGVGSAPLGGLQSTATGLSEPIVGANAPLGGSYSTANAIVSVITSGGSQLGSLTGQMSANGTVTVSANASLGELVAMVGREEIPAGSFGGGLAFIQPNFVQPQVVQEVAPVPSHIVSFASARLGRAFAIATSQIDFSITEDDAEILLLT
jgi:hypothetical protein